MTAYIAAEYFADAIAISPNYKIDIEFVKILRNLIGRDVCPSIAEYLDKKSKKDFLYIFKKFPDVFCIEENSVGLTEAFLPIYNMSKFSVSKKYHFVNSYVENRAVEYFKKILQSKGPKPYLELFDMLMADDTQRYAKYFFHLSVTDILDFFINHSDYFTVIHNNIVFLNTRHSIHSYYSPKNKDATENMKMFELSTYFLLSCFKSLHYIELKQCLSYVQASSNDILAQISLVRQRELFSVLPLVSMNVFGFVSLKAEALSIALPDVLKAILLLVCILAFEKEIYISDLAAEFSSRIVPSEHFFKDLTFQEKVDFIGRYPSYFHMSYTTYTVSLLPEFILPECVFPQSSENEINHQTAKNSKAGDTDECSDSAKDVLPNSSPSNMSNMNGNREELLPNSGSSTIPKNVLCLSGVPETVIERMKQSFLYLSKYFYPLNKERAVQTLLHAVDDVRISFCSFTDKHEFIGECCDFMKALSNPFVEGSLGDKITEKEKNLLFIIYMLTTTESKHFTKIIETMKNFKIDNILVMSTVSDQFKYFKTLTGYVDICSDGKVVFTSTYYPIKSLIHMYSDLFSDPAEMVSHHEKISSAKVVSHIKGLSSSKTASENKAAKFSKALSWVSNVVPSESKSTKSFKSNSESSLINDSAELPDNICKILSHCAKSLRKYDEYAAAIHILKAAIFSFTDIYNYLNQLSIADQYKFVERCFKFLNKENHQYNFSIIRVVEMEYCVITYLLLKGAMHYRKITIELFSFGCKKLPSLSDQLQYWYFRKAANYFIINSDGFVCLNSSFSHIDLVVDGAVNKMPKHQSLSKKSVQKSENFPTNPKQPVQKTVMVADSPAKSTTSSSTSVTAKHSMKLEVHTPVKELDATAVDADTKIAVIDITFFILSVCEKMTIEKLCYRLNSCNFKGVHNMFSSCTITEKLNFFKTLSPHFEVSKDNVVSLNKDVNETFVPKTNINLSELFEKSDSSSEKSFRSRSGSVKSTDTSEVSELVVSSTTGNCVSKRRRSRRRGSKKHENTNNKVNYEVRKVQADSSETRDRVFYNSNLGFFNSPCCDAENVVKTPSSPTVNDNVEILPPSPISIKDECSSMKDTSGNDVIPESVLEGAVEVNESKEVVLPADDDDDCMIIDQIPKVSDGDDKEQKCIKSLSESMASSLEKAKNYSLSISEDIHKLKTPRQPNTESISKLSQSSLNLLEHTSTENKFIESVGSPVSNSDKIPMIDYNLTLSEMSELKSNLSSASASETQLALDNGNNFSLEEISEFLPNSTLTSLQHPDLKNDASYRSYISDLIDDFLYSAKTNTLDLKSPNLNNEQKDTSTDKKDNNSRPKSADQTPNNEPQNSSGKMSNVATNLSPISASEIKNEETKLPKCTKVPETVPHQVLVPGKEKCDKTASKPNSDISNKPKLLTAQSTASVSTETADWDLVIEDRAVTFFSLMLKKYQDYDESIPADYLRKVLYQASSEVRSFMQKYYASDFLPFFQKHNKVFYVSPITHCVYLSRKSAQKLRLNLS